MNVYLKIDYSTAKVYEYSKEKVEGFEEHTSKTGKVSYRKFFPRGVYGTLRGVTIREVEFSGAKTKELSIAMRDKDMNNIYLNIPLFDNNKNITDYAEGVISYLNSLEAGKGYRVYPYNIPSEKNPKYSTLGVSFRYADVEKEEADKDTVIPKLTKTINKTDGTVIEGDIPAVIWEQDIDDSWTKNTKARNKYLFEILKAYTEKEPVNESPAPQKAAPAAPKKEEPKNVMQPNTTFDDSGDLPF